MACCSSNSVLVIGAGELGTAVLSSLATHPQSRSNGNSISLLLRPSTISTSDPAKKSEVDRLRSLGVKIVPGDIANDSVESLSKTFAQFKTVVGCSGMTGSSGTQTRIAKAVLAAKVPRYIPWQFGVDYDLIGYEGGNGMFAEQLDLRGLLRAQTETEWKIISTGMFMSFIFEHFFGVVKKHDQAGNWIVNALGSWDNQVTLTDVHDIGRCAAEVVWQWDDVRDPIVFVAGDTVTYREVADAVEKTVGGLVERVEWTVPHLQVELANAPEDPMKKYRVVFAEGKGLAWPKATSFNGKTGIKTMTIEEGAKKYLQL